MKTDRYTFSARLIPALIAIMPVMAFFVLIWPNGHDAPDQLKALGLSTISFALLAQFGRDLGKRLEPKLFEKFDGMPSTALLRHRDSRLDAMTKARYHSCLSSKVPNIQLPTATEETNDPSGADKIYASAVSWLRVRTRDDALLLNENISYGMRRNLLGLKYIGIVTCLVTSGGLAAYTIVEGIKFTQADYLIFVLSVPLLLMWFFIVKASWVLVPAEAYARRLLENCDKID